MDFNKIRENAIAEFDRQHPKLKDASSPTDQLAKTIASIAMDAAIESIKEYDRQKSLPQKEPC